MKTIMKVENRLSRFSLLRFWVVVSTMLLIAGCGVGQLLGPTLTSNWAEDEIWNVQVLSVEKSSETISDNTGGSISPNEGFIFLTVHTTAINNSSEEQELVLGMGEEPAHLTDESGNPYDYWLGAISMGSTVTTNSFGSITYQYIYPNAPDGETIDFVFVVPEEIQLDTLHFTFQELSPIALAGR